MTTRRRLYRLPKARHTHDAARLPNALVALAALLISTRNPAELRLTIAEKLITTLPSLHGALLWLYDRSGARLGVAAASALPYTLETSADLLQIFLRAGEGPVGQAFQRTEPQFHEAAPAYREPNPAISPTNRMLFDRLSEQLPRRSRLICLPLRNGNSAIGVIELICEPDLLLAEQRPLLDHLATMISQALVNTENFSEASVSQQRLQAFDAVVTAIGTAADLNDLMRSVLDVVLGLVPSAAGALMLLDRERDRFILGAAQNLAPTVIEYLNHLTLSNSPLEEVVQFAQPVRRPLIPERGEGVLIEADLINAAYLPLLAGGTVAGVLLLFGDQQLIRNVDLATMMPICNQVGFAIANVRLYDESQSERRKLTTLINSIAEGVIICDHQGRLTLSNDAAREILRFDSLPFGQRLDEMLRFYGMRDLEGRDLEFAAQPLARALDGETFHDYRLLLRGGDNEDLVISFSGAPAYANAGTTEGAVVVFRDITRLQRVERSKDEFLAVAAHELRSPLAAVRSYGDMLLSREKRRGADADARDIQGLTILTQQVQHMLRLVDNLLDLSRLDAGQIELQLQTINIVWLANQVLDQHRYAAGGRELVLDHQDDELWVECDSLRIRQVLTNLVSNAIKYGPTDGRVTVVIDQIATPRPDQGPLHELRVSVRDQGKGIPAEQKAKLFERFYRIRESHRPEGLGLGLYLSREFVLLHGGRIWFDSIEAVGTTFFFTLPLSPPTALEPA